MIRFGLGFLLGLAVATVGFSGLASIADKGVKTTQVIVKEVAKPR